MHARVLAALVGAVIAAPVAATTTTIDFNTETRDGVESLTFPGVSITAPGGRVFTSRFGNTPNGTRGIVGDNGSFLPLRATFSMPVSAVSVDMGDFSFDEDVLFLRAFDANNSLVPLAAATDVLPAGVRGMRTLSVAAANIAVIEFGGIGVNGSSVFSDNLVFTTGTNAIPEPASWAMLIAGFGLAGAAMRRRRAALAA